MLVQLCIYVLQSRYLLVFKLPLAIGFGDHEYDKTSCFMINLDSYLKLSFDFKTRLPAV